MLAIGTTNATAHTAASGSSVMHTVSSAATTVPNTPCRMVVRGPKSPSTRPHSTCRHAVPAPMSSPAMHTTAAFMGATVSGEKASSPHVATPMDMEAGTTMRYHRPCGTSRFVFSSTPSTRKVQA